MQIAMRNLNVVRVRIVHIAFPPTAHLLHYNPLDTHSNVICGLTILSITHWCVSTHIVWQSCASLCPSHRYQFVSGLVNADLRLTMHDIISGTRCPRDAPDRKSVV